MKHFFFALCAILIASVAPFENAYSQELSSKEFEALLADYLELEAQCLADGKRSRACDEAENHAAAVSGLVFVSVALGNPYFPCIPAAPGNRPDYDWDLFLVHVSGDLIYLWCPPGHLPNPGFPGNEFLTPIDPGLNGF